MRDSSRPGPQPVADDALGPRMEEQVDVWTTLAIVLERRRLILAVAAAVLALGVAYTVVFWPRTLYTSSGSFFPQQEGSPTGQLAGLAARFGVEVAGTPSSQSPEFYTQLLRSRRILGELVRTVRPSSDPRVTLADVLLPEPPETPAEIEQNTVDEIRDHLLAIDVARNTDVVSFAIRAPAPELAKTMADTLIALVKRFDVGTRQSQAAEERRFAEERLREVRAELAAAEADLQAFLEKNRQFDRAPQLQFEHDRLERTVAMRQDVVTSLAQSLEQAKINEVRSAPLITVLETPQVPVKRDPRGLLRRLILLALFSLFAGVVYALVRSRFDQDAAGDSRGYARAERAWRETREGLGSVFARRSAGAKD